MKLIDDLEIFLKYHLATLLLIQPKVSWSVTEVKLLNEFSPNWF